MWSSLILQSAVGAALCAYSWVVAGMSPFSWPNLVVVELSGIAALVMGSRARISRGDVARRAGAGLWVWGLLLLVLVAWQVSAFLQHPRYEHPTLSSLANNTIDSHGTRAIAFLGWLVLGRELARR